MVSGDNLNGEMVVYVGDDGKPQIQARLQDKNMWLTQVQLAQVFQTKRQNIGQHIKNIYEEKELDPSATIKIKKFLIIQTKGDRKVLGKIERLYFEDPKVTQKRIEGEEMQSI